MKTWEEHTEEIGLEPGDFNDDGTLKEYIDAKGKRSTPEKRGKISSGTGKTMKKVGTTKLGTGVPFGQYNYDDDDGFGDI